MTYCCSPESPESVDPTNRYGAPISELISQFVFGSIRRSESQTRQSFSINVIAAGHKEISADSLPHLHPAHAVKHIESVGVPPIRIWNVTSGNARFLIAFHGPLVLM